MCARYEMTASPRQIMERFHLEEPPLVPNKDDMRPTDQALIIDQVGPRLVRWGLEVSWLKQPMINARAETLKEKTTFRPLLENRCLVPMTAYIEWRKDGKARLKNRISDETSNGPLAFAGLLGDDAFTIVTCAPAPSVAHVHGRMPVILGPDAAHRWVTTGTSFTEVAPLLQPYDPPLTAIEETPNPPAQADLFG